MHTQVDNLYFSRERFFSDNHRIHKVISCTNKLRDQSVQQSQEQVCNVRLRRKRQEDQDFKVILGYIAS